MTDGIRVQWWQDGIHIGPSNNEQRQALADLYYAFLDLVNIDHDVPTGPVAAVEADDQ